MITTLMHEGKLRIKINEEWEFKTKEDLIQTLTTLVELKTEHGDITKEHREKIAKIKEEMKEPTTKILNQLLGGL